MRDEQFPGLSPSLRQERGPQIDGQASTNGRLTESTGRQLTLYLPSRKPPPPSSSPSFSSLLALVIKIDSEGPGRSVSGTQEVAAKREGKLGNATLDPRRHPSSLPSLPPFPPLPSLLDPTTCRTLTLLPRNLPKSPFKEELPDASQTKLEAFHVIDLSLLLLLPSSSTTLRPSLPPRLLLRLLLQARLLGKSRIPRLRSKRCAGDCGPLENGRSDEWMETPLRSFLRYSSTFHFPASFPTLSLPHLARSWMNRRSS